MQNNCSLISYFRFLNFFLTCSKRNLTSKTIRKTYPTDSQSRLLLTRFNNFWDYLCCVEETVVNITPMLSPSLSAPGFDGRTWETLKEVFQENEGVLLKYVQCITKVSLPECMQDYLASAKIIPLAKKSMDTMDAERLAAVLNGTTFFPSVTPIAIASVWTRVSGACLLDATGESLKEAVGPLQLWVKTKSGLDVMQHTFKTIREANPKMLALHLDFRNAFDEVS